MSTAAQIFFAMDERGRSDDQKGEIRDQDGVKKGWAKLAADGRLTLYGWVPAGEECEHEVFFPFKPGELREIRKAIVVDFINYVGACCGVDYGMYTRDV